VFSGRIHVFLAKLFPLNEKSGLNLMSHFSENMTRFTSSAEIFDETINKSKNNDSLTMELDDVDRIEELKSQQQ
jgi:THO complex subunit 1